jgi:isoleucyl-tRNA synthetase
MVKLLGAVDLSELCITSDMTLSTAAAPDGAFTLADVADVAVVFKPATGQKCERCWRVLPDVGTHKHPATCQRCNDALG